MPVPAKIQKPAKPHKDFPLFAHKNGQWCKKVRGVLMYFGRWADPQAALAKWLETKDYLLAGVKPPHPDDALTLEELIEDFLNAKRAAVKSGELAMRSYTDYIRTGRLLAAAVGKLRSVSTLTQQDFSALREHLGEGRQAVAIGNEVRRIKAIFRYAYDSELIARPVKFGPTFRSPSKLVLRRLRASKPPRMYEALEIRTLYAHASPIMRAMLLLGINCGFGNTDCANLHRNALDLERGIVSLPRSKTGTERNCPLWPETIDALRDAMSRRPIPLDPADDALVFITRQGRPWVRDSQTAHSDAVAQEFRKLRKLAGITAGGFYWLRHTFETVGGESRDQVAVNHIMGHEDETMAGQYRERVLPERLRAVTDYVRQWLIYIMPQPSR